MWEFFWFFLGAFFYKFLAYILGVAQKGRFINDIKLLALQLLGQAAMELAVVRTLRNNTIKKENALSDEEIKLVENDDELFFKKWKRDAVDKLNSSVPPIYKPYVDVKDWEEIAQILIDCHDYSLTRSNERGVNNERH
jgi:hypothetical protein